MQINMQHNVVKNAENDGRLHAKSDSTVKCTSKGKSIKKKLKSQDVILCCNLKKLEAAVVSTNGSTDGIRSLTTKILSLLKTTDSTAGMEKGLPTLLTILKTTEDPETVKNIVFIIEHYLEFTSETSAQFCMSLLLSNDITGALFHGLHSLRDMEHDAVVLDIFAQLALFAYKDEEFAMKLRHLDIMQIGINVLKRNFNRYTVIKPILQVIRAVSTLNSSSFSFGKECIHTLLHLLDSMDPNQPAGMKLILDTLNYLLKVDLNCEELVLQSGIVKLFSLLNRWERVEGASKLKILRSTMQCLINVTDYKIGRLAVTDADGLRVLYRFCHNLPLSTDYDSIVSQVTYLMIKCLPVKWLPLQSVFSAVSFHIPEKSEEFQQIVLKTNGLPNKRLYNYYDELIAQNLYKNEPEHCEWEMDTSQPQTSVPKDLVADEVAFYKKFLEEYKSVSAFSDSGANVDVLPKEVDVLKSDPTAKPKMSDLGQTIYHWNQNIDNIPKLNHDELHGILTCYGLLKNSSHGNCSLEGNNSSCSTCSAFRHSLLVDNVRQTKNDRHQIEQHLKSFNFQENYTRHSNSTKHVSPFVKLAYPDVHADKFNRQLEPLYQMDVLYCRNKLLKNLDRILRNESVLRPKTVYDYDALSDKMMSCTSTSANHQLDNDDPLKLGVSADGRANCLQFESRFESGNLRKAIMVGSHSYELILNPDVNSSYHHQWFYFQVRNMEAGVLYSFNIINCEKGTSQFAQGMKPVFYSVKEAELGRPGWVRCGTNICYFRNGYSCLPGSKTRTYFTVHFRLVFPHGNDVCYLAYHYPYTYTLLKNHLQLWNSSYNRSHVICHQQNLCHTLNDNEVPVLTVTSTNKSNMEKRSIIFLTARVHPGETNSSWVMKGTIDYLLSDKPLAEMLREQAIFIIVPMLNPDGVINGCHRCSLSAEDLNRTWINPSPTIHPTIYHVKALLMCLRHMGKSPLVFCDFHGHSRRKNIFLFGCNGQYSWHPEDIHKDNGGVEILGKILSNLAPAFNECQSNYAVEKNREGTARVTVWRQLGVTFSYTMESTHSGCDQGPYKGFHIGIPQLLEMGAKFCQGIYHFQAKLQNILSCKLKGNNSESTEM